MDRIVIVRGSEPPWTASSGHPVTARLWGYVVLARHTTRQPIREMPRQNGSLTLEPLSPLTSYVRVSEWHHFQAFSPESPQWRRVLTTLGKRSQNTVVDGFGLSLDGFSRRNR